MNLTGLIFTFKINCLYFIYAVIFYTNRAIKDENRKRERERRHERDKSSNNTRNIFSIQFTLISNIELY